jgi:hypothetical protein
MAYGVDFTRGYDYAKKVYREAESDFQRKKALSRIHREATFNENRAPFDKGMLSYYWRIKKGEITR